MNSSDGAQVREGAVPDAASRAYGREARRTCGNPQHAGRGPGRPCVTDRAYACWCLDVPPRHTENASGGVAARSLVQRSQCAWRSGRGIAQHREAGRHTEHDGVDEPTRRLQGGAPYCSAAARSRHRSQRGTSAGPGDAMLRLDLGAVAAVVVVVVDGAVVRAVLVRRRVERGHPLIGRRVSDPSC